MKKIAPRDARGNRVNGKSSMCSDMKPFDQYVLTKKEMVVLDKLFNKLFEAAVRFHKAGKCNIENEGIWPCETEILLVEGKVHHYPNGYYI